MFSPPPPPPPKKKFYFYARYYMRISLGSRFILFHIELIFLVIIVFFFFLGGGGGGPHFVWETVLSALPICRHGVRTKHVCIWREAYSENPAEGRGCSIYPFPHERILKPLDCCVILNTNYYMKFTLSTNELPFKVYGIEHPLMYIYTHCTNVYNLSFYN